jgi:hypothetical protein
MSNHITISNKNKRKKLKQRESSVKPQQHAGNHLAMDELEARILLK